MNYETGLQYAEEITNLIQPYCEKIKIAGGIRRQKENPHDIELVVQPIIEKLDAPNLYGHTQVYSENRLDPIIQGLIKSGHFHTGEINKAGRKAPCGPRNYRLKYKDEQLDIFAVLPPADWPVILTIRTGDGDFSHWLVQQGYDRGLRVKDGHLEQNGKPTPCLDETDFLRTMIGTWVEPKDRNLQWITSFEASRKAELDRVRKMM